MLKEAGGADVILDNMGASYLGRNVSALATGGRLVIIGMQGGAKGELDINALLRKRASVTATSLRARPLAEKAAICCGVVENVWPLVASGQVRPIVETTHAPRGRRPRPPADGGRRALREDRPDPLTGRRAVRHPHSTGPECGSATARTARPSRHAPGGAPPTFDRPRMWLSHRSYADRGPSGE